MLRSVFLFFSIYKIFFYFSDVIYRFFIFFFYSCFTQVRQFLYYIAVRDAEVICLFPVCCIVSSYLVNFYENQLV